MTEWIPGVSQAIVILGGIFVSLIHLLEYDYHAAHMKAREKYSPKNYDAHVSKSIARELSNSWIIVPIVYFLTLLIVFKIVGAINNSLMILIALGSPFVASSLAGLAHQKYLDQIAAKYQKRHP